MKVIFVSGPYRAENEWCVIQNIRRAESIALEVWKMGAACHCPHKNTAMFGGAATDEVWLNGDIEIMRRCDAVITVDGWEKSVGARVEVEIAQSLRIPVFHNLEALRAWLESSSHRIG